jgi:hypothetical protein
MYNIYLAYEHLEAFFTNQDECAWSVASLLYKKLVLEYEMMRTQDP